MNYILLILLVFLFGSCVQRTKLDPIQTIPLLPLREGYVYKRRAISLVDCDWTAALAK